VIDGPINGESFLAYVEQILVPALKPGDIVIIDNLGSQGKDRPPRYPGRRRKAVLPTALQPRPQPDRASLCQTQDPASKGCRANRRRHLEAHRHLAHLLYPPKSAPITSPMQDTLQHEPIML
jgi:hypothetical protein